MIFQLLDPIRTDDATIRSLQFGNPVALSFAEPIQQTTVDHLIALAKSGRRGFVISHLFHLTRLPMRFLNLLSDRDLERALEAMGEHAKRMPTRSPVW